MKITLKIFNWAIFIVFGLFLTRATDLMLVRGAYFKKLADFNRVRRVKISPARGRILDTRGVELARNSVRYFDSEDQLVTRENALEIEASGAAALVKEWVREYPLGESTAHLTGYLGEASEEEVFPDDRSKPGMGDLIGRGGIEQFYDSLLRGVSGEKLVEVGAKGEEIRELGRREAKAGEDIFLSLDSRWQEAAWQALSGHKGAVVILDPDSGAILSLVSWPAFDPNLFTKNRDEEQIHSLLNDSSLPFLNRAIGGAYHPGSVFKMITSVAGLQEGEIDRNKEIEDTGVIEIGKWRFGNWYWLEYGRTDGMVNLEKAIKRSNDIYFYKVGEWVGIGRLLTWAEKFNLGQTTGIDIPGEVSGFLPSPQWKEEIKGERWFLGNTYHLSIGQGDLTMTPLQVAIETAAIANGGKICRPHLVGGLACQDLWVKQENIDLIKKGMVKACSTGGTGFPFFNFRPQVGCKTGTAEVGDGSDDAHAWFTLFFPADSSSSDGGLEGLLRGGTGSRVVITVLVERGGSGAYIAAPIAKEIIERYQGKKLSPKPVE